MQLLNKYLDEWRAAAEQFENPPPEIEMRPVDEATIEAEVKGELAALRVSDEMRAALITAKALIREHARRIKPTLYRKEYCHGVMNGLKDAEWVVDCVLRSTN